MKPHWTHIALALAAALLLAACASIGNPEGGPRDYTPPALQRAKPMPGAIQVSGNKVEITFDEIINLKEQQKKVVVSPTQREQPLIRALGKKITIEFRDEMLPNTTYCIDFTNAIEDNNEGNVLDGFSIAFSTGDIIDTLAISGIVLRARDLEPMQHVLVGLHSNLHDSAFTTLPLERITRTNDRGQFTLRNLKPGSYHLFAINDMDGDYRMARTEDIAFLDEVVVPTVSEFTSSDTVFTFDHRIDTVVTATHTDYLPNDLLLCMFNEDYHTHYLKTVARPDSNRLHVLLGAPADTLPTLTLLRPQPRQADWYRLEYTARNDSLFYWITDPTLMQTDTIVAQLRYLRTDTASRLVPATDTVTFSYRKPNSLIKEEKERLKQKEKNAKRRAELEQKQAQGKTLNEGELDELHELLRADTVAVPVLKMSLVKEGTLDVTDTLAIRFDVPIAGINPAGVHLEMKRDSLWLPLTDIPPMEPADPYRIMQYNLPMLLQPDSTYRLTIDSLAVTSIYGEHNAKLTKEIHVRGLEEYANIYFRVTGVNGPAVAELLDSRDAPLRTVAVANGGFEFLNVVPGNYYVRLTLDANGNGRWDTGNYASHLQPEQVYYYPKRLKARRNWDMDETWDIYAAPYDRQKPDEIRINKPEKSKNKLDKNARNKQNNQQNEEEEEDEFNSNSFLNNYSGNKYQDHRTSSRNTQR